MPVNGIALILNFSLFPMPKKPIVAIKPKSPKNLPEKHVTKAAHRGQQKDTPAIGKKHQPSKGVKAIGSKVGFGAQSQPAHKLNAGYLKAFQMAKSSDGKDLESLHMKGSAGKTSQNQGYKHSYKNPKSNEANSY